MEVFNDGSIGLLLAGCCQWDQVGLSPNGRSESVDAQ